jgi:hypothetical protein
MATRFVKQQQGKNILAARLRLARKFFAGISRFTGIYITSPWAGRSALDEVTVTMNERPA